MRRRLDGFGTLPEIAADVGHQVVALPVLEAAIALAGLPVVIDRARRLVAPEVAFDPLAVVLLRLGRLFQAAHDARLVIDMLVLAARVDAVGHLAVALVGTRARLRLR